MADRLELMTVDEVCELLEDNGFPESTLKSFKGFARCILLKINFTSGTLPELHAGGRYIYAS